MPWIFIFYLGEWSVGLVCWVVNSVVAEIAKFSWKPPFIAHCFLHTTNPYPERKYRKILLQLIKVTWLIVFGVIGGLLVIWFYLDSLIGWSGISIAKLPSDKSVSIY